MSGAVQSSPFVNAPDSLTELDQWLLWRMESVGGRPTKVPYSVRGYKASSTDPRAWAPFDVALKALFRSPDQFAGLGFVFAKHGGIAGIDLDDCLNTDGEVKEWARGVVERFAYTYMEISPSGLGLKIWSRGSLPANMPKVSLGDGGIEMYDHSRYFTFTGQRFRGAPLQVEDHAADLRALYGHLRGSGEHLCNLQLIEGGLIPHGRQHSTLVSICGTLRRRGICDEAIEACLQIVNARQCEKPGPRGNISKIVRSSRKWGAA